MSVIWPSSSPESVFAVAHVWDFPGRSMQTSNRQLVRSLSDAADCWNERSSRTSASQWVSRYVLQQIDGHCKVSELPLPSHWTRVLIEWTSRELFLRRRRRMPRPPYRRWVSDEFDSDYDDDRDSKPTLATTKTRGEIDTKVSQQQHLLRAVTEGETVIQIEFEQIGELADSLVTCWIGMGIGVRGEWDDVVISRVCDEWARKKDRWTSRRQCLDLVDGLMRAIPEAKVCDFYDETFLGVYLLQLEKFMNEELDRIHSRSGKPQLMEQFVCVTVLMDAKARQERNPITMSRPMAEFIAEKVKEYVLSNAFQRAAPDYTWSRILWDITPFIAKDCMRHWALTQPTVSIFSDAGLDSPLTGYAASLPAVDSVAETPTSGDEFLRAIFSEKSEEDIEKFRKIARELSRHEAHPVIAACRLGSRCTEARSVVSLLVLELGHNPSEVDSQGYTALFHACQVDPSLERETSINSCVELIDLLVSLGCDPNFRCAGGAPVLAALCANACCSPQIGPEPSRNEDDLEEVEHLSSTNPDCCIVTALLDAGADACVADAKGMTALHHATAADRIDLLDGLKAAVACSDNHGYTALHLAASYGRTDCCTRLVQLGSPLHARNSDCATALQIASQRKRTRCAAILLRAVIDQRTGSVEQALRRELPSLEQLDALDLTSCGISYVPAEIAYCSSAKFIDLRGNQSSLLLPSLLYPRWVLDYPEEHCRSITMSIFISLLIILVGSSGALFPLSWWASTAFPPVVSSEPWGVGLSDTLAAVYSFALLLVCALGYPARSTQKLWMDVEAKRYADDDCAPVAWRRRSNYILTLAWCLFTFQLSSLAVADNLLWPTNFRAVFGVLVLDLGFSDVANTTVLLICACLSVALRLWFELRVFIPDLWAYDDILFAAFTACLVPLCRVFLLAFVCTGRIPVHVTSGDACFTSPSSYWMVVVASVSLALFYPLACGPGAAPLQARCSQLQLRVPPALLLFIRQLVLPLVFVHVVFSRQPRGLLHVVVHVIVVVLGCIYAGCALLPLPQQRLVRRDCFIIGVWSAAMAIVPVGFAIWVWAVDDSSRAIGATIALSISSVMCCAVCGVSLVLDAQWRDEDHVYRSQHRREQLELEQVRHAIRLHPRSDDIINDMRRHVPAAGLDKKYGILSWMRRQTLDDNSKRLLGAVFFVGGRYS